MKAADIDDQHVIDLARAWQQAPLFAAPGVVQALIDEGVPPKVALHKVEKLNRRGYLDYGTSANYSWPTGKDLA